MIRSASRGDRALAVLDQGLRAVGAEQTPNRPSPAATVDEAPLSDFERAESARLLRVNRAGEIAAQALYSAQSLFARSEATRRHLQQAAREESDHLAWCTERLRQIGGRKSRLDPLWYFGSAAVGMLAGVLGDERSLGFVAETERQVEAHIDDHLHRLPPADAKSRAILEQMAADETRHGHEATAAGGVEIPQPARRFMAIGGEVLRRFAYWV